MHYYSKLSFSTKDVDPRKLCSTVLAVYAKRVSLRNVTPLCKVPNRPVRDVLYIIAQKQKKQKENDKEMLIESEQKLQITRLIGDIISYHELMCTYTKSEPMEGLVMYFTTKMSIVRVTESFGIPRMTVQCWTAKACHIMGAKKLQHVQVKIKNGEVSRKQYKDILCSLVLKTNKGIQHDSPGTRRH